MDLGTGAVSTAELLALIGDDAEARSHLLIREWQHIVAWAGNNVVDVAEGAATIRDCFVDTGVPIAGPGAPLVSEFALMELVAVLGRTPDGGRAYVGKIIECAWRLPELHAEVMAGRVEVWRALRVAELTHPLCAEAAAHVDHHLATAVGAVSWALIERLVKEAVLRFEPERAEAERARANDHRHFDLSEIDDHGLVTVSGLLDAADGRDLDEAIAREATLLGQLGDGSSLDVRRSKAAGALARRDLVLDLLVHDEETGKVIAEAPGRKVTMTVHVTDRAEETVGRWEEGRTPVSIQQIEEWLTAHDTTVTIRPVIDLAGCVPVDSYEIPDRLRRQVTLRDHTCRHPHCTRVAVACDVDHAVPHGDGGATCPCNLVPLCRRHHRAKTHSRWTYRVLAPGLYQWRSPLGLGFLVTALGTFSLDHRDPDRT
ncbi:HNH endonuclease signature motif containing protein [Nocardioides caeni]|uniref:HNH endonuclease n=1 Tax=Nocardioides caeni TaxID=574700 RepID=A0A4S8NQM0_9ACTN|nr:HNH endonuclease signature motif containing protein [Nocardioides caeni]THV18641.1 HNH endonuclease [Nocardioides caeni]